MTVEFFGVRGFSQIGGVKKTDRPGETQKADKTSKNKETFSNVLQSTNAAQNTQSTQDVERASRIQALKQQVADGSYEPDLQKVASSLLKFLVEEG